MKRFLFVWLITVSSINAQISKTAIEKAPSEKESKPKLSQSVTYHEDGKKVQSKGYINASTGNPEGTWCYYYETGDLKEKGKFKNGIKTGEWLFISGEKDSTCIRFSVSGDSLKCNGDEAVK